LERGGVLRTDSPIAISRSHDNFAREVQGFRAVDLADLAYNLMVKGVDKDAEELRDLIATRKPEVANSPLHLFSTQLDYKPVCNLLLTMANKPSHRPVLYVPDRFALNKPIRAVHPNYFFVREGKLSEVHKAFTDTFGKKK
jgi:hypothetical protein